MGRRAKRFVHSPFVGDLKTVATILGEAGIEAVQLLRKNWALILMGMATVAFLVVADGIGRGWQ